MSFNDTFAPVEAELLVATVTVDGAMAFRNRAWVRMLGVSSDPWDCFDTPDAAEAAALLGRARKGELLTNQLFLVPLHGFDAPKPLLLHFFPVEPAVPGKSRRTPTPVVITGEWLVQPESWTGTQTERHRMEILGRMTMGMAHDFNNLLSAILGHVDLMRASLGNGPEAAAEHVDTIERAARDGASLIEKVQRYIRQEKQAAYGAVDIPGLIQDCITLTRPYWYNEPRRQGIEITVEQHLEDVPTVMGSAAELRDVIVNMVLNAVQAMPHGGIMTFRTWSVNQRVFWSVADTGTGMSESVQTRIFEPMFTTKGDRGNGMGLAVANGVVQEHGGAITVISHLGRGTRFTVDLPAAADVPPPDRESTGSRTTRTAHVLVVDDEAMVRTVLRRLLGLRGHQVDEASSGAEALDLLTKGQFDVVITDQGMPAMNGREFARHARQAWPDLPIILLSGDTHVGEPDEIIQAVLSKPFRIDEVDGAIQRLI